MIADCELLAEDTRITLFNFKNPIQGDLCGGSCSGQVALFREMRRRGGRAASWTLDKLGILDGEDLGDCDGSERSERVATAILKDEVREALLNGSDVRNCFNCRLHGLNWNERPPVFCRPKKTAVNCAEAADCPWYSPFSSASEADCADVENAEYLSRNRNGNSQIRACKRSTTS